MLSSLPSTSTEKASPSLSSMFAPSVLSRTRNDVGCYFVRPSPQLPVTSFGLISTLFSCTDGCISGITPMWPTYSQSYRQMYVSFGTFASFRVASRRYMALAILRLRKPIVCLLPDSYMHTSSSTNPDQPTFSISPAVSSSLHAPHSSPGPAADARARAFCRPVQPRYLSCQSGKPVSL